MNYSIVMPYWNREEQLKRTIEFYHKNYPDSEIIVVVDGCDTPDVEATLIELEKKDHPLNSCIPINRAVEAATNEIVCLTGPEILPREPFLEEMAPKEFKDWITAACWSDIGWYSHSSINKRSNKVEALGDQAGLHFCAMFHRDFYLGFGGMDESYRHGTAWEDNDLLCSVHYAGGRFIARDDLIVDHLSMNKVKWKMQSNEARFIRKWRRRFTLNVH